MDSKAIRDKFLQFFKTKAHKIVPSAPIVVKEDPTLMFTNAGMNQFKDYFLGHSKPAFQRAADTQRCLRVSGKHNDLEEVGRDTYHHTMFEMLGNWSFGDYFKQEAIEWAWELLTRVYNLDKDRLYASVFEGDQSEGLDRDNEALSLWKKILPEDRIIFGSKKDNFWEMGETGPCGPCSEIHIDLRSDSERENVSGRDLVNQDHPLVVEIWNLVFMEFNRTDNGQLVPLPEKHIDTGMGFERLCMAIQGKVSNYDTDVFQPMIKQIADMAGIQYGIDEKKDIALRVIADHIRAVSFAIADGQLPSNTGGGYVIRRILRRAVRYGFTFLDFHQPFFNSLVPHLASQFKGVFDELNSQKEFVQRVIIEEEKSFLRTLEKGLNKLENLKSNLKDSGKNEITGADAFELYDTYGFPFDLTRLIASENDLQVDSEGFKSAMAQQKSRSKEDAKKETGDWIELEAGESEFVGYQSTSSTSHIIRYRTVQQKGKKQYQLVLNKTPFYAESGGQVGDTGWIIKGNEKLKVLDTQKENNLIVHQVDKLPTDPSESWEAIIDEERRESIMNNHSATHLMHAALKRVLGEHVEQRGSLVNEKLLRFDFSHFSKLTEEEIQEVEVIVNRKIRENISLEEKRNIPIEQARKMGATALFGEKYGDFVRVITFDENYSRELCGGTHVPFTGQIGYFKITNESSIAAGIRRIEAVTGVEAEHYIQENIRQVEQLKALLKSKNIVTSVQGLMESKTTLEKEIANLKSKEAGSVKETLLNSRIEKDGKTFIIEKVSLPDSNALKQISFELKNQLENLVLILAANINGKPQIAVMLSESILSEDWHAGKLVKEFARLIQGGGGGQPFYATAGGKDLNGLEKVISAAKEKFDLG